MSKQTNQLHKKIMRRVYYAFALRVATHRVVLHTALLVVSVYALSKLLHIASIIQNVQSIEVGNVPTYVVQSFMHAEFLTLICIGLIFFTLISFNWGVRTQREQTMQTI